VKIRFTGLGAVPNDDVVRNWAYAQSLGFPKIGKAETEHLAVVGGGPSIADRLDELKVWPGDIWAINGAFQWLRQRGVRATFFSIDPTDLILDDLVGARRAVLGMTCHRSVFSVLSDIHVEAFSTYGPDAIECGATTATSAIHAALVWGYKSVTFFGCEGSWGEQFTHAYGNARPTGSLPQFHDLLRVSCNGQEFLTAPDMIMQVEFLSRMIRELPKFAFEKSGGLLGAAVESPDIDVIAGTAAMHQAIEQQQEPEAV
jgi:hypothetical protein